MEQRASQPARVDRRPPPAGIAELIGERAATLTAAERRVAEVVVAAPQQVAFGTVAELAAAASAGAATVVRLSTKLGFDGYTALQDSVRAELVGLLRPAAERIRQAAGEGVSGGDVIAAHRSVELANVERTLDSASPEAVSEVVDRLASVELSVAVLSGDASDGIARQFTGELDLLRPGVTRIHGNPVAARRDLALLPADTTLLVVDVVRYDRWVVELTGVAATRGSWIVALTDSRLSPLAVLADRTFVVAAGSVGPFDSHVGTLSLLHLLLVGAAERLRPSATARLDEVERAWTEGTSLTDR